MPWVLGARRCRSPASQKSSPDLSSICARKISPLGKTPIFRIETETLLVCHSGAVRILGAHEKRKRPPLGYPTWDSELLAAHQRANQYPPFPFFQISGTLMSLGAPDLLLALRSSWEVFPSDLPLTPPRRKSQVDFPPHLSPDLQPRCTPGPATSLE